MNGGHEILKNVLLFALNVKVLTGIKRKPYTRNRGGGKTN